MKLYLLRHGQTDWNVQWKLQGVSDTSLNENGINQAREAASRYADLPFDAVYSSPLKRAKVTAEILAEPHGLTVIEDKRIIEMCFGDLEGTTPEETKGDINRYNLFHNPPEYIPTGNGESFEQVRSRCEAFVEDIKQSGYEHVLVVSHGGLCRGIESVIFGRSLKDFWGTGPQGNCEIIEVEL